MTVIKRSAVHSSDRGIDVPFPPANNWTISAVDLFQRFSLEHLKREIGEIVDGPNLSGNNVTDS